MEGILPAVISSIISGSQDTALEHLVLKDIPGPCLLQILGEVNYYDRWDLQCIHALNYK